MIKAGKTYFWLFLYGIAMGALEAVVVVYLRQIYYPLGFEFPLKAMDPRMVSIEILREAATLLMLVSIGAIAGRTRLEKFVFFLFSFGVWDVFYYAGLKLLLGWPASFLTWDILFLIPITWAGPVLAPMISSLTMMGLSFCLNEVEKKGGRVRGREWAAIFAGAAMIFSAFVWDFAGLMLKGRLPESAATYVPMAFQWPLYLCGEIVIIGAMVFIWKRSLSSGSSRTGPRRI